MKDRFDLETDITAAWGVTDDIDLLMESIVNSERFRDMPPHMVDKVSNALLGIKELYDMRFERLWGTFEELITTNQFNNYEERLKEEYETNENIETARTNYVQETNKRSVEDAWSVHNDFVTGTFSTGSDDVITIKVPEQSELKFDYDYGNKDDYSKYTI
jgi:hypothetical protein